MTFLSYTTGIPNAPNSPSVDQPNMKVNNDNNATLWTQDHFGFQNNAGGYHKQVHMKNQAAPGGIGANANGVLYANSIGGISWPLWQNTTASYQLAFTNTATANNGQASFPGSGGIVVKWGAISSPVSGSNPVVFSPAFSTACYNVQLTLVRGTANTDAVVVLNGTVSATGFTAVSPTGGSTAIFWVAIGS